MHKKFTLFFLMVSAFIIGGSWAIISPIHQYLTASRSIDDTGFLQITKPLLDKPRYQAGRKNFGPSFSVNLVEQYNLDFAVGGALLDATDYEGAIRELNAGDTVTVMVNKNSYESGYVKGYEYKWYVRSTRISAIVMYSLRFRGKEYIQLSKYGWHLERRLKRKILVDGIIGLFFIGFGVYSLVDIFKENRRLRLRAAVTSKKE